MAQEMNIGSEYQEFSNRYDKASRELKVEPYCRVTIERNLGNRGRETLYVYDVPRWMTEEYYWVFEWRKARFVNMYPRDHVSLYYAFYDKTTGLELGLNTLRSRQIAAKALISRYKAAKARYINDMKATLFFDEKTDENIRKVNCKIASAEARLKELTEEIEKLTSEQNK